jgi:hypothetical protein
MFRLKNMRTCNPTISKASKGESNGWVDGG